jgi:hypothetical protein
MECQTMFKKGNNPRKAIYIKQSEKNIKGFKEIKNLLTENQNLKENI